MNKIKAMHQTKLVTHYWNQIFFFNAGVQQFGESESCGVSITNVIWSG